MKSTFPNVLLFLISILFTGCYAEKIIPNDGLEINDEERVISYQKKDGQHAIVPPAGLHYETAVIAEDTLIITFSAAKSVQKNKYTIDQKIPFSEIQSLRILPHQVKLRYGSVGLGIGPGLFLKGGFAFTNNNLGGNIHLTGLWYKAKDLPEDYTGLFNHNNIYVLSILGRFGWNTSDWGPGLGLKLVPQY